MKGRGYGIGLAYGVAHTFAYVQDLRKQIVSSANCKETTSARDNLCVARNLEEARVVQDCGLLVQLLCKTLLRFPIETGKGWAKSCAVFVQVLVWSARVSEHPEHPEHPFY